MSSVYEQGKRIEEKIDRKDAKDNVAWSLSTIGMPAVNIPHIWSKYICHKYVTKLKFFKYPKRNLSKLNCLNNN